MDSNNTALRLEDASDEAADSLQTRVTRTMLDDGLKQKETANQIGVSTAVLNQWLQGKYRGDNAGVETKIVKWLSARGERVEMAKLVPDSPLFFESATAMKIIHHLRLAQTLQDMLTVFGVPGAGKTTALRHYQRAYPNVWIATMSSSVTSVVPVLQEICDAVRAPKGSGASRLMHAIVAKVRSTNGLLVIDEAHHMGRQALDSIRALHDATGIAIALVGGVELESKIQSMPQFDSRVGLKLFVTQVLTADVSAQLDAWKINRKESRVFLAKLAQRPGALRLVNKTLRLATMVATGSGSALELEHIRDAAETLAAQATADE